MRLKSNRSFLSHVQRLVQPKADTNVKQWIDKSKSNLPFVNIGIQPPESFSLGSNASGQHREHSIGLDLAYTLSNGDIILATPPVIVEQRHKR